MESIIKWQTGKPKEEGEYLVTIVDGRITIDRWLMPFPCNWQNTNTIHQCGIITMKKSSLGVN